MRIAIIDTYYNDFLKTLTLGNGSYQEELDKVLARQFGTADFYSREFRKLRWEAIDIIANYPELQSRWLTENNEVGLRSPNVVLAQLAQFRPDVLFIQDLSLFAVDHLRYLAERYLLVAQLSCAFDDPERVKRFHTIFTSFPHYIPKLKAFGVNAVYMPLAFHESVLWETVPMHNEVGEIIGDIFRHKTDVIDRDIDVSFVGGIGWQWKQGLEVLEAVAREIPTFQWWGYGVEQLSKSSPLISKYRGTAWGDEMYAIYQRSKIVINRHGEIAENYANNMRMYEATGCGAILATEDRENLDELFELSEAIWYSNAKDAVNKIHFALQHYDFGFKRIGQLGQKRTLSEHTYAHRVPKIAEVLTNAMAAA